MKAANNSNESESSASTENAESDALIDSNPKNRDSIGSISTHLSKMRIHDFDSKKSKEDIKEDTQPNESPESIDLTPISDQSDQAVGVLLQVYLVTILS